MDRISLITPRTDVSLEATTPRPTPKPGVAFRDLVTRSASTLVREAQAAVTQLPGGPVLAAALRGNVEGGPSAGNPAPPLGISTAALSTVSPTAGASSKGGAMQSASPGAAAIAAEGPGTTGEGGLAGSSVESTLQTSQDMNLYFLQLQESIAAENRSYTACSNVLKARHDTVKNAIGNIR